MPTTDSFQLKLIDIDPANHPKTVQLIIHAPSDGVGSTVYVALVRITAAQQTAPQIVTKSRTAIRDGAPNGLRLKIVLSTSVVISMDFAGQRLSFVATSKSLSHPALVPLRLAVVASATMRAGSYKDIAIRVSFSFSTDNSMTIMEKSRYYQQC